MKYPVEHWLDAEDLPFKYNPELIQEILNLMTPERSVNMILHPDFRKEEEDKFSEKDDWFGVFWREKSNFDYKFKKLDNESLFYPGENPYLTDKLDLIVLDSEKTDFPTMNQSD